MTDREKLIELIKGAVAKGDWTERIAVSQYSTKIADHLLANGVTVQQWIPVTERLPEEAMYVLCATKDGWVTKLFWDAEYRLFYGASGGCGYNVTHWMPLPEAPKEE